MEDQLQATGQSEDQSNASETILDGISQDQNSLDNRISLLEGYEMKFKEQQYQKTLNQENVDLQKRHEQLKLELKKVQECRGHDVVPPLQEVEEVKEIAKEVSEFQQQESRQLVNQNNLTRQSGDIKEENTI